MTIDLLIDYDLLADKIADRLRPSEEKKDSGRGAIIHGIRGLAKFLGCSPSKAQDMKNKGLIPFSEIGRKVFFYENEVVNALSRR